MKSFVALLVVALALTATAQSTGCLSIPGSYYNSSYIPTTVSSFISTSCAQCGSGFLLTTSQGSTCTACPTGCTWCTNSTYCLACSSGYQLVPAASGVIVQNCTSCGSNAMTCTVSGTTVTITACNTGYYLLAAACASCATTVSSGTTAAAPGGIVGCAACGAAGIVSGTAYYVTCSSCITGYAYVSTSVPIGVTGITIPWCISYSSTTLTFGTPTTGNTYQGTTFTLDTNGLIPTIGFNAANAFAGYSNAAATYFCPDKSILQLAATAGCQTLGVVTATSGFTNAGSAGTSLGTCTSGTYAVGGTGLWCKTCSTGVLYASGTTSTTCITAIAGCAVYSSSTACSACNQGFNFVSATSCVNCTLGGACSSGYCGGSLALNVSGTCVSATQIAGCLYHNGTGNCAVCQGGFATTVGVCGNCPSSCSYCTSSTACAVCNANYVLSSGACSAKPASNPNSGKFLFAGLAFISMIFYYIF